MRGYGIAPCTLIYAAETSETSRQYERSMAVHQDVLRSVAVEQGDGILAVFWVVLGREPTKHQGKNVFVPENGFSNGLPVPTKAS